MQKRYFPVSSTEFGTAPLGKKLNIPLPIFFKNSNNEKHIIVRNCKIVINNVIVNDIKLYSDIVSNDAYDDHFICFTNELMVKPKKYRWLSNSVSLNIWFSDMKNNPIEVEDYLIDILLFY
jgi:hypothetical protein